MVEKVPRDTLGGRVVMLLDPDSERTRTVIRASALRIELTDSSDDCLIRVHGEIDLDNIDAFESAFAAAFDSGVPLVLLDLSNVTFCAACGIGILLSWHHEMEAHGRTLVICTPSRIVRRVFALTGADAVVEVR